jgi:hypothetical protein
LPTPYLVALVLVAGSLVVGRAICRTAGATPVIAPAVGCSALVALTSLAVRLPGDAVTAAVAAGLAVAVAAVMAARNGLGRPDPAVAAAALGTAALTALPFLAWGRLGLPGVSLNNDTAVHLVWSEGMRSELMAALYPSNPGYPLGPHSLMATLAEGTGLDMDRVLTGLLIASPVLLAIMVAGALRPVAGLLRAPAAMAVAMSYLVAAWYGQGAFKEPLVSFLVVGFALGVGDLLGRRARLPAAACVPVALICAGALLVYSYLAIAWLGLTAVIALVLTVARRRTRPAAVVRAARSAAPAVALGVLAALAAVAVELPRLANYAGSVGASPADGRGGIAEQDIGNLAGPLPATEGLGIWPAGDFRFAPPPDTFALAELQLLTLIAVVAGAVVLIVRGRHLALPAALGAAALLYLVSERTQSPYVAAKALVVLSPLVTLVALRALLPEARPASGGLRALFVARIAGAVVLGGATLWSAERVLRASPVESQAQRQDLESLRPLVARGPTLHLGVDDYAGWRLRGTRVAYVGGIPSPVPLTTRAAKPYVYGNQLDWDSVDPAALDRFRYVIAVRSPSDSAAPANFRRIAATALYEAWERTGPTAPRDVLEREDLSGAPLDCTSGAGRRLARGGGVAGLLRPRVVVAEGLPALLPGQAQTLAVTLPRGRWTLAAKYTSPVSVRLQAGRAVIARVPANTNRPGPWWPAGRIDSDGSPQQLFVIPERESRLTTAAFPGFVSGLVAVRDGPAPTVPLRRACGRLVDWYRPAA